MENPLLQNAIESARLGFYDDARGLLLQVIRQDPNNALAWLWLAQTLDDPKRQADCLSQALRVEPDNPDALAAVEALRTGMPLPEPGGGIIAEPEPEFPESDELFGWGELFTEETEAVSELEPEPESLETAEPFGWGELYTEEPETAAEPEPEPDASDDMFGWGELFAGEPEPEPEAPVVEEPVVALTPGVSFIGIEEEEAPPEPEPATPEPVPEPEESFLQRARRLRTQGFAPSSTAPEATAASEASASTEPSATSAFVPPFTVDVSPETTAVSYEPEAAVVEELPTTPVRKFRIFDWRVLFSILGLVQLLGLIGLGVWYFFLRTPSEAEPIDQSQPVARALPRPALGTCRALNLDEFTSVETLGGELTVDTVFTGTQVAITETLVVPAGVRLLIYPGATLVFTRETSLDVYGTLYACGNEDAPLIFTAFDKTPAGWEGISLYNPTDATVLSHAVVEYAGERALYLENSVPVLDNIEIARGALFPVSIDGGVVPDLSKNVSLADSPVNGIEVRPGTLYAPNTVWPSIKSGDTVLVYVVPGLLRVDEGATLDIQSGAIVKFWHMPKGQLPGIWVHGLLQAEGATFTSIYDSAEDVGGTTYMEAIDPQSGDWGSLTFFESSEKSYLRDVVIRYAGQVRGAVTMQSSSPELTRVTVTNSSGYPLSADARSFPVLDEMTLTDNTAGNGMEVYGGLAITGREAYVWERLGGSTQVVRVVRDTVTVGPDATLQVQPGVVVKFTEQGQVVVQGAVSAIGGSNVDEEIVFTSLHDDDHGGDTDGATNPQDSRVWGGITMEGVDATTELQSVVMRYAPITLVDAAPRLFSDRIEQAPGAGLRMTPGSSPDMRGARFEDNGLNGIAILTGTLIVDQQWSRLGGAGEDQIVRVLEGEVTIGPGAVLEIEPDVVVKASPAGKLLVLGHLRAKGRADQLVTFTSLNDDVHGGDTNLRPLNAGAGDWPGIEVGPEGNALLSYVGIYYADIGLNVLGTALPAIEEGRVHIAYGKQPLACTARVQIPPAYFFEYNEIDVTRCPSP